MNCPECGHLTRGHFHDGTKFQCWERMSHDNNDFCGCQHGSPLEWQLEKDKKRLAKEQAIVDDLTRRLAKPTP